MLQHMNLSDCHLEFFEPRKKSFLTHVKTYNGGENPSKLYVMLKGPLHIYIDYQIVP